MPYLFDIVISFIRFSIFICTHRAWLYHIHFYYISNEINSSKSCRMIYPRRPYFLVFDLIAVRNQQPFLFFWVRMEWNDAHHNTLARRYYIEVPCSPSVSPIFYIFGFFLLFPCFIFCASLHCPNVYIIKKLSFAEIHSMKPRPPPLSV